jgi:putative NIF3 family GTP cyclohydrolase 1 type 2
MKVKDITEYLETIAPKAYQESYDNSGLLTGEPSQEVTGALVTLDCIEAVVDEAIAKKVKPDHRPSSDHL